MQRQVGQDLGSATCGSQQAVVSLLFLQFVNQESHQRGFTRAGISFQDEHARRGVLDECQQLLQHQFLTDGEFEALYFLLFHNDVVFWGQRYKKSTK